MKIKCVSNIPGNVAFEGEISEYITPGKTYESYSFDHRSATIEDDEGGQLLILINGYCAHGKWEKVEE